jgi:CheY-like chemotaxis protein
MEAMISRPILVVDDDTDIRDFVVAVLRDEGYPVRAAANGKEALAQTERARPSLVLLDIHMPILDGEGFAAELHARGFDPPIVVMSATGRTPKQLIAAVGASGALEKPVEIADLLIAVERWRIP